MKSIDKALELIEKGPAQNHYFFQKLGSVEWVKLLSDRGFFSKPPDPYKDENDNIVLPVWAESQFLERVADQDPATVMDVILAMPDTANDWVRFDCLRAALKMPATQSARIVPKAREWAKAEHIRFEHEYCDLISHLAEAGLGHHAIDLANVVFDVLPVEKPEEELLSLGASDVIMTRLGGSYGYMLREQTPGLARSAGMAAVLFLSDLLDKAIALSELGKSRDACGDWSCGYPSINKGEAPYAAYDLYHALFNALRLCCRIAIEARKATNREVIELFMRHEWRVFRRFAMHVAWQFPQGISDWIERLLTDPTLLQDFDSEYKDLLAAHFDALGEHTKRLVLEMIQKGRNAEVVAEDPAPSGQATVSDKEVLTGDRYWKHIRLFPIREFLFGEVSRLQTDLFEEFGQPQYYDEGFDADWTGEQSPKSADELGKLDDNGLVNFLATWKPDGHWSESSRAALALEIKKLVLSDPARYSAKALLFRDLHPVYVSRFADALREAVEKGDAINFTPVMRLSLWVSQQGTHDVGAHGDDHDEEVLDWTCAKQSLAMLLSPAFRRNVVPSALRDEVWEVLALLCESPDPTPQLEAEAVRLQRDPYLVAINSVRGESFAAVFRYLLWVCRQLEKAGGKKPDGWSFVALGQERARMLLERHLDVRIDPSLAVRSVYGLWFPHLIYLDLEWARKHETAVFPANDDPRWWAAWSCYVTGQECYNDVFKLLRNQYSKTVDLLVEKEQPDQPPDSFWERFGERLMVYYWRGLDGASELLERFWRRAPAELRRHVIRFGAESLTRSEGEIDPKIPMLERLRKFWDHRLSEAQESAGERSASELGAFGGWFSSNKFAADFALQKLGKILKATGGEIEGEREVIERLASIAETQSEETLVDTVNAVDIILKALRRDWHLYEVKDMTKRLVQNVRKRDYSRANIRVTKLVEMCLDEFNWFDFKGL